MEIFTSLEDEYGVNISKRNYALILHSIPDRRRESEKFLEEISKREMNKRERAWLCNIMALKFRKYGTEEDLKIAYDYAEEAKNIGEFLGDKYLIALNSINKGNVLFDQGNLEQAKLAYEEASNISKEIFRKDLEASASTQLAEIHNDQKDHELAKFHALYAAGLAEEIGGHFEKGQALNEYARACYFLQEFAEGCNKSLEAALEIKSYKNSKSQAYFDKAVMLAHSANDIDLYLTILKKYFLDGKEIPKEIKTPTEELHYFSKHIILEIEREHIFQIFGTHLNFLFEGLPELIQRQIFNITLDQIINLRSNKDEIDVIFFGLFTLSIALNPEILIREDLINAGEKLRLFSKKLGYKPGPNGQISFYLNLDLGKPLTLSVHVEDDRKDTLSVGLILIIFLLGFEKEIKNEIVMKYPFEINELEIIILNYEEAPSDLRPFFEDHLKDNYFAVPSPVSPKESRNIPLAIICRDDISKNWRTASGSATSIQLLLSNVLSELVYRLFDKEVDLEAIQTKIISLVKQTIS